jgi:hypothetical protein
MDAGLLQQTFICPGPRFLDYPFIYARAEKDSAAFPRLAIGDHVDGWRVGSVPGAVRGYGGKAKAISPDAIGPARFPGARMIEANRHHPRGISVGRSPFY